MLRKSEEMRSFRRAEFRAARQILEERGGDPNLTPLLQPRIPSEPDTSECSDLFSSKPPNPAATAIGKADFSRRETRSSRLQELCQLLACAGFKCPRHFPVLLQEVPAQFLRFSFNAFLPNFTR